MQMKRIVTALSFMVFFLLNFQNKVDAQFPMAKEYWMLAPMYNYYSASSYWNNNGKVIQYKNNGRFTSHYFGLYGAFGLDDNLNFTFNVPFVVQTYSNATYLIQNSSLGDATAGLNYFLHLNNPNQHLSLGGSLIIPLYRNTLSIDSAVASSVSLPYSGFQKVGVELKVGFAGTNVNVLKNTYYDLQAGVRDYFGGGGPTQVFLNATFGVPLNENIKIAGTLSGVNSGSNSVVSGTVTTGANTDFSYARLTFAAGVKISEEGSLWGHVFTDVSGRNIGLGSGFSVFAVFKF